MRELLRLCYRADPTLYARDELGVVWWGKQVEIARALITHKRVFVKASHSVGKTHLAGGLVNWFFDTHKPSVCLTTAPTHQQVCDVLWKEVRVQRKGRPGLQPKAPRMETAPDHFAVGYTAGSGDAFQGRHERAVFGIFDEATGVDTAFWDAMEGMMTSETAYWLAIMNPTDTSSRAYEEEQKEGWHVITVSAVDHPNIAAELEGQAPPFPAAVRLAWVEARVREWCTAIPAADRRAADIEFPPQSGRWHRPGPLFESRVLGRWPSTGSTSVWTEAMWMAALTQQPVPDAPLRIGCDVARFGDDFSSIVAGRAGCALHHETHNGWDTAQTAGRLKSLAKQLCRQGEDPSRVEINVDDDGVGGGVTDQRGEFLFVPVGGGMRAFASDDYPNRRSEMWFACAQKADEGRLDLSRLTAQSLALLRRQAMAPTWKVDSQGRRVVEPKADTKKRIGRSPDDMDALNLLNSPGKRMGRGA